MLLNAVNNNALQRTLYAKHRAANIGHTAEKLADTDLQESVRHSSTQLSLAVLPGIRQNAPFDAIGKAILLPGISKLDNQRHLSSWQHCLGVVHVYGSLSLCPLTELYKCAACKRWQRVECGPDLEVTLHWQRYVNFTLSSASGQKQRETGALVCPT